MLLGLIVSSMIVAGRFSCILTERKSSYGHAYICKVCRDKWYKTIPECGLCGDGVRYYRRFWCGHIFHNDCLHKYNWMKESHVCPTCKKEIELINVPKKVIDDTDD